MDTTPMSVQPGKVTVDVVFEERISRLFVFRFLRIYPELFILIPWMLWIALVNIAHFWFMLILGKRHVTLWNKQLRFFRHLHKWNAYMLKLTNVKPKWIED